MLVELVRGEGVPLGKQWRIGASYTYLDKASAVWVEGLL